MALNRIVTITYMVDILYYTGMDNSWGIGVVISKYFYWNPYFHNNLEIATRERWSDEKAGYVLFHQNNLFCVVILISLNCTQVNSV
jgi:hypothetical protein